MATAVLNKPAQIETPEVVTKTRGIFQLRKESVDVWSVSTVIYGSNESRKTTKLDFEGVSALFQLVGLKAPSVEVEKDIVEFVDADATSDQINAFCLRMAV